jgi:hypothetical protein
MSKMTILNYIDELIERKRSNLGQYPEKISLTQEVINKMKELLDTDHKLDNCWYDTFPSNYRGIKIEIVDKCEYL